MKPKSNDYRLSFTACGLLPHESVLLANLYLECKDWNIALTKVFAENLLQARLQSTLKRITLELIGRLKQLNNNELAYLTTCEYQEKAYILWIAVCRYYQFVADFAVEVLHEKSIHFVREIDLNDFDSFVHAKSDIHEKLASISVSTRGKLRQVLFKMLKETNLLSKKNEINKAIFNREFIALLSPHGIRDIRFFPASPEDIKRLLPV